MRTVLYAFLLLTLPGVSFSQNRKPLTVKPKPTEKKFLEESLDKIFEKVEPEAGPIDPVAWNKYIQKIAMLPDSLARQIPAGTYKVTVKFIIDKDGYIGQVEAINDPGFGLSARAVRMIRNYNIAWRQASQCGRTVKSYHQQAIVFTIID